ncbi:MAG: hypothetical protein HY452_01275 [Parcubacteria group bacterium]|nr:hypothetical protein [Parcubacteria group bacterium]
MSDKALNAATLELTQRIQVHFPRDISLDVLGAWNSCSREILSARLTKLFGEMPESVFLCDMSQEGWTLLEDACEPWPISVADLEPVSFLKEGKDCIGGEEMVRRSREELHANLGQRHAEYLLENQHEIPEELRKFVLVFTGTIWRLGGGGRGVPCLVWGGGRWRLDFGWLVSDFRRSGCRLLRPHKAS